MGGGSVGTFEDCLDLDLVSVASVEGLLCCGGDHAVSCLKQELLRVLADALSGAGESGESTMLGHVVLDRLNIEAIWVVTSRVVLDDSGDLTTVLLDELRGPVADSAKALDDKGLAINAKTKAASINKALRVEHFADGVVDTETS